MAPGTSLQAMRREFDEVPLRRVSRLALLLVFTVRSTLGIALGQTVLGSPIVSDVPVANGTERVLFLGTQGARVLLVLLPGSHGVVGPDQRGRRSPAWRKFLGADDRSMGCPRI
jgi:hypothetical protein